MNKRTPAFRNWCRWICVHHTGPYERDKSRRYERFAVEVAERSSSVVNQGEDNDWGFGSSVTQRRRNPPSSLDRNHGKRWVPAKVTWSDDNMMSPPDGCLSEPRDSRGVWFESHGNFRHRGRHPVDGMIEWLLWRLCLARRKARGVYSREYSRDIPGFHLVL
jgi:hypothetical protein